MAERDAELQGVVDLLVELERARKAGLDAHWDDLPESMRYAVDSTLHARVLFTHRDGRDMQIGFVGKLVLRLLRALQAGSVVLSDSVSPAKGE